MGLICIPIATFPTRSARLLVVVAEVVEEDVPFMDGLVGRTGGSIFRIDVCEVCSKLWEEDGLWLKMDAVAATRPRYSGIILCDDKVPVIALFSVTPPYPINCDELSIDDVEVADIEREKLTAGGKGGGKTVGVVGTEEGDKGIKPVPDDSRLIL